MPAPIEGIKFNEILYADDTQLIGTNTANLNRLIKEIQVESEYYNLALNYDKCENLTINRETANVRFKAGNLIKRTKKSVYLGAIITERNDNITEIQNRITECNITANKLKLFWNKSKKPVKWKIIVYDAVIRSKLLYGLETMELTNAQIDKLDAFQMKGHRRILGIPPTFIDRTWTNKRVKEEIENQTKKPYKTFSEQWNKSKLNLLGHVLRSSKDNPLYQVCFEQFSQIPRMVTKRRAGKPRMNWLDNSLKQAYEIITKEENEQEREDFDLNNDKHIFKIRDRAKERKEPFSTKPRPQKTLDHIFKTPNKDLGKTNSHIQETGQPKTNTQRETVWIRSSNIESLGH